MMFHYEEQELGEPLERFAQEYATLQSIWMGGCNAGD